MNTAAAFSFAVICEAPADLRLATALADRVLCKEIDWIHPEDLDLYRSWRGLEPVDSHLEWHWVSRLAKQQNLKLRPRPHGNFGEEPAALAARKALLLLARSRHVPDAVVLVCDTDGREELRRGLEQARDASPLFEVVVLAVAHTKRECWVLAGFDPHSEDEEEALAGIRRELGFDPRLRAESLTATEPQAPRNAKRVLNRLTGGNPDREQECWTATDLATLRERGRLTGLSDFLDEVRKRLVSLFTNRQASP